MKLLFSIASTILISQFAAVLAEDRVVEDIKAAEEIEPTTAQSSQGETELIVVEPFDLNEQNFYELVVDKSTDTVSSDKPWFIKFYAPWCGHCKRLAPIWDELYQANRDELNVGKVDCTTDLGKPLCGHYEVKGYPTLLFFPTTESARAADKAASFIKFQGPRSLDYLQDFALKAGWESADSEEIPKNLEGLEYWQRYFSRAGQDATREIDMVFVHYGYDKMVPPVARYTMAGAIVTMPLTFLFILLCCCSDDFSDELSKAAGPKVSAAKGASPKRKPEKID